MSKIRCPNCGKTNCEHRARYLAEADEADQLARDIWEQDHPGEELPPPPYSEASLPICDETNKEDLARAQKIIELDGEDGYRSAAGIIGPDKTDELLADLVARNMGTTSNNEEVREFVAEVRSRKGF